MFISTDNGANWNSKQYRADQYNCQISCISNSNGYIFAGTDGGVFRGLLSTTSTNETDSKIPSSFVLEQNYPNPFNPVTTIKFSVPLNVKGERSNVTLKVYDVLGNEVATLFNEYKSAGSYEVVFDANKLSSGVYFYRLQAGNFVDTKKMLLLK